MTTSHLKTESRADSRNDAYIKHTSETDSVLRYVSTMNQSLPEKLGDSLSIHQGFPTFPKLGSHSPLLIDLRAALLEMRAINKTSHQFIKNCTKDTTANRFIYYFS